MIEVSCQTCGEKAGVQSFLAAAQQTCTRCGELLMGPLGRGNRSAPPAGFADLPAAEPRAQGSSGIGGLCLGIFAGVLVGLAVVAALAILGPRFAPPLRGAILGALSGVLLAPILAVSSFISMLIFPFSLEGLLGDSLWSRMATALHEHRFRPLIMPLVIYVVLPMALCGFGGSRMKASDPLLVSAALGAMLLGAIVGGMCVGRRSSSGNLQ